MQALNQLLQRHPVVFFHLVIASAALLLGGWILSQAKGTPRHRLLGWAWALLMASTAVTAAFIRDYHLPNLFGFTPIHGFVLLVAVQLPRGIWYVRQGNVLGHRQTMRKLYIGSCVVAGIFTLLPGRFLGTLLWKNMLGVVA